MPKVEPVFQIAPLISLKIGLSFFLEPLSFQNIPVQGLKWDTLYIKTNFI